MFLCGCPAGFRKGHRSLFCARSGLLKGSWHLEPPPPTTTSTMRTFFKPSNLVTPPPHPPLGNPFPPPSQTQRPLAFSPFTTLCRPTTHCVGWPSLLRERPIYKGRSQPIRVQPTLGSTAYELHGPPRKPLGGDSLHTVTHTTQLRQIATSKGTRQPTREGDIYKGLAQSARENTTSHTEVR